METSAAISDCAPCMKYARRTACSTSSFVRAPYECAAMILHTSLASPASSPVE